MSFTESIRTCFRKYYDFDGRACRSEFWFFFLFSLIIGFVIGAIQTALAYAGNLNLSKAMIVISILIDLAMLLPSLGVMVRRLHDIGRSGLWILLVFIPFINFIGAFVVFVMLCLDSTPGENAYGENPFGAY